MAQHKITSSNSIYTTSGVGILDAGFFGPFPNTLLVDASSFVISTADNALQLGQFDPAAKTWAITVNGVVASTAVARSGIYVQTPGWNSIAPSVTLTVGLDGEISGNYGFVSEQKAIVTNKGSITAKDPINGVAVMITENGDGDSKVTNNGDLIGGKYGIQFRNDVTGKHTIVNTGRILVQVGGASIFADPASSGIELVTNSGYLEGDVNLGGGADSITNSGTIVEDLALGSGDDLLNNSGNIFGAVFLGSGADTLNNSGTIHAGFVFGDGGDSITNSGTIGTGISFGAGTNALTNSGAIKGDVIFSTGADTFSNSGTVDGVTYMGDGNDTFTGGTSIDRVADGNGADTIILGGGDDSYLARGNTGADGNDLVDGGAGFDYYSAYTAPNSVRINLDTIAHDLPADLPQGNLVAANTATGADVAGALKDTIKNFEGAIGSGQTDIIHGSAGRNELLGDGGSDYLFGYAGNDSLGGGDGYDLIVGGLGADYMWGGANNDVFKYYSTKESGLTKATRDTIGDFSDGNDIIDLQQIDANTANGTTTNDAFTFIGMNANFTGAAGQLRAYMNNLGWTVDGDVNGDKKADFSIQVIDTNHIIFWSHLDFGL